MPSTSMSTEEVKKLIKQIVEDEFKKKERDKKIVSKEDVRDIVKDMLIKQYKFFWEKKSAWINHL